MGGLTWSNPELRGARRGVKRAGWVVQGQPQTTVIKHRIGDRPRYALLKFDLVKADFDG